MKLSLEDIDGVGPTIAKKWQEAGFTPIETIAVTPIRELLFQPDILSVINLVG